MGSGVGGSSTLSRWKRDDPRPEGKWFPRTPSGELTKLADGIIGQGNKMGEDGC